MSPVYTVHAETLRWTSNCPTCVRQRLIPRGGESDPLVKRATVSTANFSAFLIDLCSLFV